ncbi:MAG: hypothetical protein ACK55Z_16830, partial [bacterium]
MALSDLCGDLFAIEARSKIKELGALPCVISLFSSPDHYVQEAVCNLLTNAAQDVKLLPTLGKLDTVAHLLRLLDCSSCAGVQSAAMLALVNIVQTTTSAKRFNHLAGADALYRAL